MFNNDTGKVAKQSQDKIERKCEKVYSRSLHSYFQLSLSHSTRDNQSKKFKICIILFYFVLFFEILKLRFKKNLFFHRTQRHTLFKIIATNNNNVSKKG